ncbi:MAG: zinc-binding dehydrogenase [Chloroflexaceae bacterium]|nr:zinc-binding dehydrogenase [Chloroflexaceae bacterium]
MTLISKAVVIPRRHVIELHDVKVTQPTANEVLIRTAYTSISAGTERMLLDGKMPHPALSFPIVPGYETVGRIVEVGSNVSRSMLDQWVYVGGARCFEGVNPAWGGQSQFITTDADRVVPLTGFSNPEVGIFMALGATALHGVNLAAIRSNDRVMVLGQGIVGQLVARLARLAGAAHVTVVDRVNVRLDKSQADRVINVRGEALEEALEGERVDVLIEATGSMTALSGALPMLENNGRIILLGYYEHIDIPYAPVFMREAQILVAREWKFGPDGELPHIRDIIANNQIDVSGLITHRVPLDRIQAAYRLAFEDPSCLKVVVEWPAE